MPQKKRDRLYLQPIHGVNDIQIQKETISLIEAQERNMRGTIPFPN